MNIDRVIEPNKLHFEIRSSHVSRVFGSLIVLVFFLLLTWGGLTLSGTDTLPIKQVRVEGDFTRLSPVDLQLLVTDKVRGGFFSLDVDAVRLALFDDPWVSQVTVKRIWPDTLRVIVIEQIPVVRWGESGLLNTAGEYFEPGSETIPKNLPLLLGPKGAEIDLLERFNAMQKQVKVMGLDIATLAQDERRAWIFVLVNGTTVVLGRRDFEERFNRFLTLMSTTLSGWVEQTESIDMRYTNGFSIKWKK